MGNHLRKMVWEQLATEKEHWVYPNNLYSDKGATPLRNLLVMYNGTGTS